MKTKILLVLSIFLSITAFAQRGVRIGYIDMEYILENVQEYTDANQLLEKKVLKWKTEIEEKHGKVAQMRKDLSTEKVLLTQELIQEREEEIQLLENQVIKYQQDRFGPKGDLMIQKATLVQPIQDRVLNAVQDIATAKKYDFIFDKSADVVMLYANTKNDISELVLRKIDGTRKKEARIAKSKNKTQKSVNPEVELRKKEAALKREEKALAIEKAKEKKLQEREARKKAYQERRKKLLAEREAAIKAKQEKKKQNQTN